jgi:hypothetical protein
MKRWEIQTVEVCLRWQGRARPARAGIDEESLPEEMGIRTRRPGMRRFERAVEVGKESTIEERRSEAIDLDDTEPKEGSPTDDSPSGCYTLQVDGR